MTLSRFLFLALAAFFLLMTTQSARAEELRLAIGINAKGEKAGIYLTTFDSQSGVLQPPALAAATPNPSFLALSPQGRFLYAVNLNGVIEGQKGGGLSSFEIQADGGLKPINAQAQDGVLCHLSVDETGKFLLASAYTGGHTTVWPLHEDGSIGPRASLMQHEKVGSGETRQTAHAHQVLFSPDKSRVFAVDLGLDQVLAFHLNPQNGVLSPANPSAINLAPKAGPRHMVFHPSGKLAYVINEHGNTVTGFEYSDGAFKEIQTISTLPADYTAKNHTAEIAIHPNGRWLFGSNRGHDSIVTYAIEKASGQLTLQGFTPTEGRNPRHFTLDPSGRWLLAANEAGRSIIVFRVDENTGTLTKTAMLENLPGDPECLLFLD